METTINQKPQKTSKQKVHFGLVICRNPKTNKFLAVNENKNRGWWIPGGGVDHHETFEVGARRECIEEAGVEVEIKGVLKIDHKSLADRVKMRVIFYAEPVDHDVIPKQEPDDESNGAEWVTVDEFKNKKKIRG